MLGLLIGGKGVPLYRWEGGQVAVVSLGAPTLALRGNHWPNAERNHPTPDKESPAHQPTPATRTRLRWNDVTGAPFPRGKGCRGLTVAVVVFILTITAPTGRRQGWPGEVAGIVIE